MTLRQLLFEYLAELSLVVRKPPNAENLFVLFSTHLEQTDELRAEPVLYLGLDTPQQLATPHDTLALPGLDLFPNLPFVMSEIPSNSISASSFV